jgi:hypothetical protein
LFIRRERPQVCEARPLLLGDLQQNLCLRHVGAQRPRSPAGLAKRGPSEWNALLYGNRQGAVTKTATISCGAHGACVLPILG